MKWVLRLRRKRSDKPEYFSCNDSMGGIGVHSSPSTVFETREKARRKRMELLYAYFRNADNVLDPSHIQVIPLERALEECAKNY